MTLRDPQGLDDLLNYRLARLHALSGAPVVRLCEGRYGITRREWRLLALLAAQGATSPSELADRAHLDRARTSRAIGSLSAKGLVQRVARPGDARRAVVQVTPCGQSLYEEMFPQVAAINRAMLDALDEPLLAALDEALRRLTSHAAALGTQLVSGVQADRRRGGTARR
ncbi:MarR family transcriptional regulator [uncultured Piscinibacter sp.]|uniref:MarR family winged helix-turn-helix transcriptional regulator n=1 Tax=uncultured Piscinibacter sp. TaxID=1131835 RepID=UPI0026162D50|nr:MarR family transcriptional regulator [uncultured Piscinibacter sp.]